MNVWCYSPAKKDGTTRAKWAGDNGDNIGKNLTGATTREYGRKDRMRWDHGTTLKVPERVVGCRMHQLPTRGADVPFPTTATYEHHARHLGAERFTMGSLAPGGEWQAKQMTDKTACSIIRKRRLG